MDYNTTLLEGIEPDVAERLVSRRDVIRKGAAVSSTVAAGLALGSVPVALAALSREAFGQSTPTTVTAALNFALMLEIFENEFYKAVLGTSSSDDQNDAFQPVRQSLPTSARTTLEQIQRHEAAHVAYLTNNGATDTLGLTAISFDFTGNRLLIGGGPFARARTEVAFLLLVAQAVEDTGVRAYKGQAPNLMSNSALLEAGLRIHSVEARHASKIRRMRRQAATSNTVLKYSGTISGGASAAAGTNDITSPPAAAVTALDAVYAGEQLTTQAGVNLLTLANLPSGINLSAAASEAFDEPLTKAEVINIVQGFFIPTIV